MEDAMGQTILRRDSVMFKPSPGAAHWASGVVLKHAPDPAARTIVVQCLDGGEVTKDARDVVVVDRSYLRVGMSVASASDPGGQVGVVTGAAAALDLVRLDDDRPVVAGKAVAPATLRRVREFALGDYVVSGPWLGRVFEVSLDVDVVFDDGAAVCRVTRAGSKLRAVHRDSLNLYTNSVFYPGQRVVAGDSSVFRAARWLRGYWKPSHGQGTVSKVETAGVLVSWVASSRLGTDTSLVQASAPPPQQSPRDLAFFCAGDAALGFWAVGDRCFFRAAGGGGDTDLGGGGGSPQPGPARALTAKRRRNRLGAKRTRRVEFDFDRSMSVSGTHTTVDVVWQDGTRQRVVPSVSLLPFVARNDHDFFPGERVVRRTEQPVAAAPNVADDVHGGGGDPDRLEARVGVVGSLCYKDQTVRVSWLKAAAAERAGEPMEKDCHETLSAYELRRCSKCDPFYGAIVVRSSSAMIGGDAGGSTEEQLVPAQGGEVKTKGLAAVNDLSWVGHIVDLCGANVQVKWCDGNTSKVSLQEIAVVKQQRVGEMLREIGDWLSYEEDGDMNNTAIGNPQAETAAIINNNNDGEGDDDSGSESGDEEGHPVMRRPGWVAVVTQTVIRLAGKVLFQARKHIVSFSDVAEGSSSELAATKNTTAPKLMPGGDGDAKEASPSAALCQGGGGSGGGGHYSTMEGKAEADGTGEDDKSFHFARFDVVQSPLDHHYIDNKEQGPIGGRKWTKRVQKEWKILENNLPDTIYVRAYEDRMDLLRAVMVGASGTPYHDGLFFFDLQLPPSYPATPPLVNYRSFGLRVNPNLYPSGTVCLSLLNTFGGHGTELWSPEASTVLQVVVSIQGLVLNAQPYYNGAGYTAQVGTPEGLRNELPYSENAYLLTLQTMLQLLRRPPAGFEDFVRGHFYRRGQHVLRACEAYLQDGALVGTLDAEGMSKERPCSAGFRLALLNVMPRLVEAFASVGVQGLHAPPLALQQVATTQ